MEQFFRLNKKTSTEDMIDTDRNFLHDAVYIKGLELQKLSAAIGYSRYYLETCIYDERMPIVILKFLSELFNFDYDKAVVKKTKKKNKK